MIIEAVRVRDGYATRLECLRRVNGSDRRIEVLLRLAEYRLTQLHRSRDVLVHGDAGDDGSDRSQTRPPWRAPRCCPRGLGLN